MKKRLFVLTGVAASGKSSFVIQQIHKNGGCWVSRDLIRLSKLKDKRKFWEREDEVVEEFYQRINNYLTGDYNGDIYCDATLLTRKDRRDFFLHIKTEFADEVIGIYVSTPLEVCLKRNSKRLNFEKVPSRIIKAMYKRLEPPTVLEAPYNEVWRVCEDGTVAGGAF